MFLKIFLIFAIFNQIHSQREEDMGFDPRCPEVDPQPPIHLPHETECDRFYKCAHRHIWLIMCPPGLHWSIIHDRCEWPDIAQCQPAGLPPTTTTTTTTSTTSGPFDECPHPDNPNNVVFLPDRTRCDGYFVCFNGNRIPRTCHPGLHWDQQNRWCDYAENVPCALG